MNHLVKNTATEIECSCGEKDPNKFHLVVSGHRLDPHYHGHHGRATLDAVKCMTCETTHNLEGQ